jgi:phosphate transport system ATP-binding protein
MNAKLKLDQLNVHFGASQAVKDVSLDFPANTVTAIIGPSGCGKSTFLRSCNRMNDLIESTRTTGEIRVDGNNIFDRKTDIYDLRMKVGMVFQRPNPFPKTIFENVTFGIRIKGVTSAPVLMEKAEKSLRDAWLWDEVKDRLHSSAMSLSGGQQQRLCIARALATEPEIILLDEPTSALDPQSTSNIEKLLEKLKDSVTIIIVTHNIAQAARVSDYTACLYLGELVEYGPRQ